MSNILEVKNVVKQYGDYTALNNVSLTVPKGSIYGLLGPNGAGKTSLIRIINQITGPDRGEVFFNGEHLSPKHVDFIGYYIHSFKSLSINYCGKYVYLFPPFSCCYFRLIVFWSNI